MFLGFIGFIVQSGISVDVYSIPSIMFLFSVLGGTINADE